MALLLILYLVLAVESQPICNQTQSYREVYPPVNLSTADPNRHLFFALIQSFGAQFNGSGNIIGVKIALDRINNRTDILPNHTLHYTLTDSQVRDCFAIRCYFFNNNSDPVHTLHSPWCSLQSATLQGWDFQSGGLGKWMFCGYRTDCWSLPLLQHHSGVRATSLTSKPCWRMRLSPIILSSNRSLL